MKEKIKEKKLKLIYYFYILFQTHFTYLYWIVKFELVLLHFTQDV